MSDAKLPPIGSQSEADIAAYVKERVYKDSPLHAQDVSRWRKAELYDQCEQWLRKAKGASDQRYATQWVALTQDAGDPNSIPLPVYNEGISIRENETARLGRPEYKPRVRARGENPSLKAKEGAEGAERALISRLKDMPWYQQADRLFWHLPGYGGAWLMSYWDQTWMDTVRVPAKCLACPRHPSVQSPALVTPPVPPPGPELPGSPVGVEAFTSETSVNGEPVESSFGLEPIPAPPCNYVVREQDLPPRTDDLVMHKCPQCDLELVPYQPSDEEALGSLGEDLPKGDWYVKVLDPYGVFPRDSGIGVDNTDVDEWVYVHVETLDWVASRWPSKVRDERGEERIHGESVSALMAQNPTLGSPIFLEAASSTAAFKEHVLVYEYNKKPWFEWNPESRAYEKNRGRAIVVVNDVVCLDATLLVDSLTKPGDRVTRVRLEFVPFEFRDGGRRTTVGQGLWDRLFDANEGINERKAQIRAVNERGALPKYLGRRGSRLNQDAGFKSTVPYSVIYYDTDPLDTSSPLQLIQNSTIDAGAYTEVNDDREFMRRSSGQVEVESGQVPPGVSAATSIAYLKTESGEKRRPRIARVRQALIRAWEHGLRLMAAFYIEPRPYSYEDETGEEREAFVTGDVVSQSNPRVDIYASPDYDAQDIEREGIRDSIQLGVLNPTQTPQLNRKVFKTLNPSLDFFMDDDLQEQQAQREWQRFKDDGVVPVIDPGLDDDTTHHQEHGRVCFSAWFRQQEEAANWDGALAILSGLWDATVQQIGMAVQQQPGLSPQPLIVQQFTGLLQAQGFAAPDQQALNNVIQWRAHDEAHKLNLVVKQMVSAPPTVEAAGQGSSPEAQSEQQPVAQGVV